MRSHRASRSTSRSRHMAGTSVDGVGDHHLAPAVSVLVNLGKVAAEGVAPAGIVHGDGRRRLRTESRG